MAEFVADGVEGYPGPAKTLRIGVRISFVGAAERGLEAGR